MLTSHRHRSHLISHPLILVPVLFVPTLAMAYFNLGTFWKKGQKAPSGLSLSQTSNSKNFTVTWTAGAGNGGASGCKLQFIDASSNWIDISSATSVNCDANASSASYSLNGDGWKSSWNGTSVRLVRKSDSTVMGTFSQTLACTATATSATSTPTIDEDCDGNWDNTGYYWSKVSYSGGSCTGSYVCDAAHVGTYGWWWGDGSCGANQSSAPSTQSASLSLANGACDGPCCQAKYVCTGGGYN